MKLFDVSSIFPDFTYPEELEKFIDLGIGDLDVWFLWMRLLQSAIASL